MSLVVRWRRRGEGILARALGGAAGHDDRYAIAMGGAHPSVTGKNEMIAAALAAVVLMGSGPSARAEGSGSSAATAAAKRDVGVIEVVVRDARSAKGAVVIQLAVSQEDYDEGLGLYELARAPIEGGEASWRFEGIPYGVYALRIFHDANSNDKLDTNFMGIPKETFAFSNNAKGRFGPASWEDARFSVDAPVVRQDVELMKVGR